MAREKICIMTDCACDLPKSILKIYNIQLVDFYIETNEGKFQDIHEITAENVFEYLLIEGKTIKTSPPSVEEFIRYFIKQLSQYDEIIYIALTSKISRSLEFAIQAATKMRMLDKRIHIFDSKHISTGTGLIALKAAEMARENKTSQEILLELEKMCNKISATFLIQDLDYLCRNGRVDKRLKTICDFLNLHLVLQMKDGFLKIKTFKIGNYEKSMIRYMKKELKNISEENIEKLCVTYSGVNVQMLKKLKWSFKNIAHIDSIMTIKASATTSGNSGPQSIGLFFIKNKPLNEKSLKKVKEIT